MDINQFLHAMPEAARDDIAARGVVNGVALGNGVTQLEMAGHDRGIAYRFDIVAQYNPVKSDQAGFEVFDEEEVCFRYIDRKNIIPMPVKNCPPEFLRFNRQGELVGGRYAEAYKAWKAGAKTPGLQLRKWGVLNNAEVATLEAEGIYTVEQWAEYPMARIVGRFPDEFVEAHKRAQQWVAGRALQEQAQAQVEENAALKAKNVELEKRLASLEGLIGEAVAEPKKAINRLTEGKK